MIITEVEREALEIDLLLDAIFHAYGYDFREYSRASITRRLRQHLTKTNCASIAHLIERILYHPDHFQALVYDISVTVTEMFRDPAFFGSLREQVIPFLKTFPFVNIWVAGCATGEEVYSLAILLKEEGLYDRTRIYATDFNDQALNIARERIYPLDKIQSYTSNYQKAGGKASLSDYYVARYNAVSLDAALQRNITFANHNLVTDSVFTETHLILCRNVLIYFTKPLQERVFSLFRDSLCNKGFLCLGKRETLSFSSLQTSFTPVIPEERIYQYNKKWK